jgi:ABC-type transport system involved in Fe-S cluster assembly fused permease/ATPase subunit
MAEIDRAPARVIENGSDIGIHALKRRLRQGRTTIVAAHRLSIVCDATSSLKCKSSS